MNGLSDIDEDNVEIQQIQRPKQNGGRLIVETEIQDLTSADPPPRSADSTLRVADAFDPSQKTANFLREYNNNTRNGRLTIADIEKYIATSENKEEFTDKEIEKLKQDNVRTTKSPGKVKNDVKTSQIWDELEDIEVLKARNKQKEKSRHKMNSIAPSSSSGKMNNEETIHDLVPAGLIKNTGTIAIVEPKYTSIGESFRRNTPNEMQCSMFCGGRRCKYESDNSWSQQDMAVKGIFSHWITDDILAMARPNTAQMEKFDVIGQFNKLGIKSIINLQMAGEHASCGPRLESSGFTYEPNDFMKKKIFYYNFVWRDFGETSMNNLLDMVKVLSFALTEGKVAVHCHAGLGRTGVLLACYLVYYLRVRSNDAIRYVRLKRPNAVQTRRQISNVKEFETFFLPQCLVFSTKPLAERDRKTGRFTVETALKRQKFVVHGFEARALKHIPKLLFTICERLVRLCDQNNTAYNVNVSNFSRSFLVYKISSSSEQRLFGTAESQESTPSDSLVVTRRSSRSLLFGDEEVQTASTTPGTSRPGSETNSLIQSCSSALSGVDDKRLDEILGDGIQGQTLEENKVTKELASHLDLQNNALQEKLPIYSAQTIYKGFMEQHLHLQQMETDGRLSNTLLLQVKQYQSDLNYRVSAWDRLATETSILVLATLFYEWLEHLRTPVLDKDSITFIVILCENIEKAFKRLPVYQGYILEYIIRFVARIQPLPREQAEIMMKRILASLTQQSIPIEGTLHPVGKNFPKLRGGTMSSCLKFMMTIYDLVVEKEGYAAQNDDLSKSQQMRDIIGGFQNMNSTNANGSEQ